MAYKNQKKNKRHNAEIRKANARKKKAMGIKNRKYRPLRESDYLFLMKTQGLI